MAWTAPITFTAGSALTFTQLNTYLRDNMLQQGPAIGTTVGDYMVSTAANTLARRICVSSRLSGTVSTTSATFVNLGGGSTVTCTTGIKCLILLGVRLMNANADDNAICSWATSGATTNAASVTLGVNIDGIDNTGGSFLRLGAINMESALTAGSNTFTLEYRANGAGLASFQDRMLAAVPF